VRAGGFLKLAGLVAIVLGFVLAAGFTAKILYAKQDVVSSSSPRGTMLEYIHVKMPAILELDWNKDVGPDVLRIVDPFTNWTSMIVPGRSINVSGGVYVVVVNTSKPFAISYRARPWHHPVFSYAELASGVLLLGSGVLLWLAGGRLGERF